MATHTQALFFFCQVLAWFLHVFLFIFALAASLQVPSGFALSPTQLVSFVAFVDMLCATLCDLWGGLTVHLLTDLLSLDRFQAKPEKVGPRL